MVGFTIMQEAKLRCVGIAASLELFEDVLEGMEMTFNFRVLIGRAVAVCIVKAHDMHPCLEILLRHSVSYLDLHKKVLPGNLADPEELLLSISQLSLAERHVAIQVFTVSFRLRCHCLLCLICLLLLTLSIVCSCA